MRTMIAALTALVALPVCAADPALEARVERIERALGNQAASSLLLQVQRLQQEVQELRGLVEMQQYKINALTGGEGGPVPGQDQPPPPAPFPDDGPAGRAGGRGSRRQRTRRGIPAAGHRHPGSAPDAADADPHVAVTRDHGRWRA